MQETEGISLEAQKDRILSWCKANGCQLSNLFIETMSAGRADNRPELQKAIKQVCRKQGALIVYSLSRLARSTKDAILISERLDKAGADLVSLSEKIDTTSAAGKMIFRMLAVLAEFERDQISERTTAAMSHLRKGNKRISSRIPLGYTLSEDGKTLIENQTEQKLIERILFMRESGLSLASIATKLEEEGIRTKTGKKWYPSTIKAILDRLRKAA